MVEIPDHIVDKLFELVQAVQSHENSLLIPHSSLWDDELEDVYALANRISKETL